MGFESNQSGIETIGAVRSLAHRAQVWIEPEWNWNELYVKHMVEIFRFESNQSGIETTRKSINVSLYRPFESNQSGIETYFKNHFAPKSE